MSIFTKPGTNSRNGAVTHNRNKEKAVHSYRVISYLLLACTLFLLAVVLVLLKRGNYFSMLQDAMSDHTFQYTDNASYIQRSTQFELMPERNTDIVFLGDSITARFEWQEYFSDLTVANRGIDSDVTEGVLNRLDTVENQHPKKIFLTDSKIIYIAAAIISPPSINPDISSYLPCPNGWFLSAGSEDFITAKNVKTDAKKSIKE